LHHEREVLREMMMGLDLSLVATGVAIIDSDEKLLFAANAGFKLKRSSSIRDKIERMTSIAAMIIRAARSHGVTEIAIEGFAYAAKGAQNDLGELHGVVKSQVLLGLGIVPTVIPPTSARKVVFDKGNIKKKAALDELTKRGYNLADHNQSDALVIALAASRRRDD